LTSAPLVAIMTRHKNVDAAKSRSRRLREAIHWLRDRSDALPNVPAELVR
jgi:hypothetical protein